MIHETLKGGVEENLLTMLCWDTQHAPELARKLTSDVFSTRVYRDIADGALNYIAEFGTPPRAHLPDLLEDKMRSEAGIHMRRVFEQMRELQGELQPDYVMSTLDRFLAMRSFELGMVAASDALQAGELEEARSAILIGLEESHMAGKPKTAVDFFEDPATPRFPIEVLPDRLRNFVASHARMLGVDPAAIAFPALATCMGALDGRIRLRMKPFDYGFTVPANLWVMLIGDPASRKSPAINASLNVLRQHERKAIEQWKVDHKAWELAGKNGAEPNQPRVVTNNATSEGARDLLVDQDRGITLHVDELSGWIGGMEKYATGRGGLVDRAFWLHSHDGGPYASDRAKRSGTSAYLDNLLTTICGGIQPDRLKTMGDITDDGLFQRFMPIRLGDAGFGEEIAHDDDRHRNANTVFYDLIGELLSENYNGMPYELSPRAHVVRARVEHMEYQLVRGKPLGNRFAGFCGKLLGMWGRLCIVLAHIGQRNPIIIEEQTAEAAHDLVFNCVLQHAEQVYQMMQGSGTNQELTRDIAGWLLAHPRPRIVASDLTAGMHRCRGMRIDQLQQALSPLVTGNWLTPEEHTANRWTVNPDIHDQFAAYAALERVRRAEAHATFQGKQRPAAAAFRQPKGKPAETT